MRRHKKRNRKPNHKHEMKPLLFKIRGKNVNQPIVQIYGKRKALVEICQKLMG